MKEGAGEMRRVLRAQQGQGTGTRQVSASVFLEASEEPSMYLKLESHWMFRKSIWRTVLRADGKGLS